MTTPTTQIEPTYDIDYFINLFSSIPEDQWCTDVFYDGETPDGRPICCARGHAGMRVGFDINKADEALCIITQNNIAWINNCKIEPYTQSTPKQRVLAALQDIKQTGKLNPKFFRDLI